MDDRSGVSFTRTSVALDRGRGPFSAGTVTVPIPVRSDGVSVQAMSWVFQHSQARLASRLVLLAIANHADATGRNSWASVGSLADEAHLSRREVQYSLRELEQDGEVVRVGYSTHRTHVYELPGMADLWANEPSSSGGAILAPAESAPRTVFAQGAQSTTGEGAIVAPEPSLTTPNRQKITVIFDVFWETFPRKVGKPKARTAYERALKRATPDVILRGARAYRDDPNRSAEFTAHPTTWLNRDGWDDEALPTPGATPEMEQERRDREARLAEAHRIAEAGRG